MRSIRAIFIKQAKDSLKNPMIVVEFLIFPAVALIMTEMIAKSSADIPNNMFVAMMAPIFAGMALITAMAGVIVEDMERKSLRFLMMAGVKSHEYLLGVGGLLLLVGTIVSGVFALIGDFSGAETVKFLVVMILGVMASIILGAIIGILAKNQQSATAISVPIAVILGFTPMVATFNETVAKVAGIFYTQQLNVIVNDFTANFPRACMVMGINIAILAILFVIAYKKKGLKTV